MVRAVAFVLLLLGLAGPGLARLTTTDDAGVVYADGEPIFPITLYAETQTITWEPAAAHVFGPLNTTAAALMARLSAAGVDNILDYPFGDAMASHGGKGPMNWTMVTDYLDGLHAANLSAIYMLDMFSYHDGADIRPAWWNGSTSTEVVGEFVAHVKDHPALFGYDVNEDVGADGLPNVTRHTDMIRRLDPGHITLRNQGPVDSMSYQSDNGCKTANTTTHIGHGPLDMCYFLYRYGHRGFLNSSDAWGAQMYPWPMSPEVQNHTQHFWSTGYITQAMNASAAMCGYASYQGPQGQYCVKRSGKDSSPENCGCRAGPGTGVKRTSVWPILQVFGWETTGYYEDCSHWGVNVSGFGFPPLAIERNMAFQAIVNGANGLTLYSLHDTFRGRCCNSVRTGGPTGLCQPPTAAEVLQRLETLETLVREIKQLSTVILSPTERDAALIEPGARHFWPEVQWMMKQGPAGSPDATLIVVNTLAEPVNVTLLLDPARFAAGALSWSRTLAAYETVIAPLAKAT